MPPGWRDMAYKLIGKNFTPPDLVAKVTGEARYAAEFDAPIPLPHPRVPLENVHDQLPQEEPSEPAPFLGNRAQPVLGLAGVPTAGREPPVVGQTPGAGEATDGTNATRQPQPHVMAHAGGRHQDLSRTEHLVGLRTARPLLDFGVHALNLLLKQPSYQRVEQPLLSTTGLYGVGAVATLILLLALVGLVSLLRRR